MHEIIELLKRITPDDFNKVVLASVALVSLLIGPLVQFSIAKRQLRAQEALSNRQLEAQELLAKRQVEMQEQIAQRQTLLQQQVAARQIADSISSRRQVWIDELRADASELLTVFARIAELRRSASPENEAERDKNSEDLAAAQFRGHELALRVKLRMNPKEELHNVFIDLMGSLSDSITDRREGETPADEEAARAAFGDARHAVVEHLRVILKSEWERVKRGDV
jgi:septal ring factor EnvC (AmiA/AmiB activator)